MKMFFQFILGLVSLFALVSCSGKNSELDARKNAAKNYYLQNCAACHAPNGKGTIMGVNLTERKLDNETFKQIVTNGTARMPRFQVPEPLLSDLAEWVKELK